MKVVQRDKPKSEDFFCLYEMANISASKFTTGWTFAVFFDWALVERELSVFQISRTARGKRGSVARQARRKDAIEHIHSPRDYFQQLRRRTKAHRVTRFIFRQTRLDRSNRAHHFLFRLPNPPPPNPVPSQIH